MLISRTTSPCSYVSKFQPIFYFVSVINKFIGDICLPIRFSCNKIYFCSIDICFCLNQSNFLFQLFCFCFNQVNKLSQLNVEMITEKICFCFNRFQYFIQSYLLIAMKCSFQSSIKILINNSYVSVIDICCLYMTFI